MSTPVLVTLEGEMFERPFLRFDSAVPTSVHKWPMSGISAFGPYDKSLISLKSVRLAIIYPQKHETRVGEFIRVFRDGLLRYQGYVRWFRQSIETFERFPITDLTIDGYKEVASEVASRKYDLVFVVTEGFERPNPLYAAIKTELLKDGLPSQFLSSIRLSAGTEQLQWVLGNMALSVYAKLGGTPWVIATSDKPGVILGISGALDKRKEVIVGFAVLFKQNGDFVLSHSKSPVRAWKDYEVGVQELVEETIGEYRRIDNDPKQIIFHFSKRPGQREIESISRAISRLGIDAKFALVHLNEYSGYRIFDTSDNNYVPYAGLKVSMSGHNSLLMLDGRDPRGIRSAIGTPSVLDVSIDKRSTVDYKDFPRIIRQIYDLAFVNWRGFNSKTVPVTINYAYLIAKAIGDLETPDDWKSIASNEKLLEKAWFL